MATSKNFIVKNGLEVGGQEVIDSSGVVTSAALGGQTLGTTESPTFAGLTVTTVDLNGGTIDGTVIGGATPAAGSFTTGQFDTSLNVDGTVTADGVSSDGNVTITDASFLSNLSSAPSASGDVIGQIVFRSDNSFGTQLAAGSIVTKSSSDWVNVQRASRMEFSTIYNSTPTLYMQLSDSGSLVTFPNTNGHAVFNQNGNDADFRVESATNAHAFFVDAGNSRVGINTSSPNYDFEVNGTVQISGTIRRGGNVIFAADGSLAKIGPGGSGSVSFHNNALMTTGDQMAIFSASEVVFNEQSGDQDFRVESDGNTHMLFVDAGNNRVGVGTSTPDSVFDVDSSEASASALVSTFRAGSDADNNRANVFIGQDDNSRGLLIRAGRELSDRAITQFFLNGSGNTIGSNTTNFLEVYEATGATAYETTFNQDGGNVDFRVESDSNSHMLFVDASENRVFAGGLSSGSVGGGQFQVVSPSIGTNVNDRLRLQQWYYGTGNGSFFTLKARREAANGVWTGVVTDFVLEVDNTPDIYTYQTFGIGSVRFNDFQSADVDFYVKTDTMNKLFIDASTDEMQIVLGSTASKGVQFTDGASERLNINYNGAQKVNLFAQSAPSGGDADVFSISTYRNSTQRDAIVISRNGSIRENPGVANNANVSGDNRHRVRYFHAGANFNNPTMTIATITATGTYPQAIFKVTIYSSGLSANAAGISVGYVTLECDSPYTTWQKTEQAFAFEFNNYGSSVPTWNITTSSNTATIAITCNRMTNYDGFYAEVEALVVNGMSIAYATS